MKELRKLNAIRAIAALIVLVSHYSNESGMFGGLLGGGAGQIGVMIFFVLSGFLMAAIYMRSGVTSHSALNFLVSRAARVLPLYFAVVVIFFCASRLGFENPYGFSSGGWLLVHLLLIDGVSVFWTIPAEVQFYLFFVLVWLAHTGFPKVTLALLATIATGILAFQGGLIMEIHPFGVNAQWMLLRSLPAFLIGALLGRFYTLFGESARFQSSGFLVICGSVVLLFPEIYALLAGERHGSWSDWWVLGGVIASFGVCVFFVPDNNKFLSNRVFDYLGNISYSIYLLHVVVLHAFEGLISQFPYLGFIAFFGATILVSTVSYHLFEVPCRRFIRARFHSAVPPS